MTFLLLLALATTTVPASGRARDCAPPRAGTRIHMEFARSTDLAGLTDWARTRLCVEYAVPLPLAGRQLPDYVSAVFDGADAITAFELLLHTMNVRAEGRGPTRKIVATGDDPAVAVVADLAAKVKKVDATHYEVARDIQDLLVREASHGAFRFVPEQNGGKLQGIKLSAIKPDGAPVRLGFANGDLVKSINGKALVDPSAVLEAYSKMRTADRMTFVVGRGDRDVTIEWRLVGAPSAPTRSPASFVAPAPDPATAEVIAQISRLDDTHYTIPRAALLKVRTAPMLARPTRIVPEIRDGKPVGFRLFGVRPGSIPAAVGITNGDVILAINGLPMTTPDKALEVYAQRATTGAYQLSIEHLGKPVTIEVKIK